MSLAGYTPEELAILTPDERSAIEADEGVDEDAITALAGEVDPDDADAVAAAAAAAAAADEAADTATTGEEGTPADEVDDDEPFTFTAPADAAERRAKLTKERDDAFEELMVGTIDTAAYNEINNRVTADLEGIASAVSKAELATAMAAHEQGKLWKKTVTEFFATAKTEGADYMANKELHAEFDGLVKIFASEAAAKGMSDVGLKASRYALEQAQLVMRGRHGFKVPEKAATDAEKAIAAANQARHGLKTLTNMPAADRVVTDDSPLSKIATLEGDELELYMATLSPADMRRLEMASDK